MGPVFTSLDVPVPWRPPSLRQLLRRTGFQDASSAAAGWQDQRFAHAEQHLPWLIRVSSIVTDYCHVGAPQYAHTARRGRGMFELCYGPAPPVTCARWATVVYGFAGPLPDRLAALAGVLEDDGWSGWTTHHWSEQEVTPDWLAAAGREASLRARWHRRPELVPPPMLRDTWPGLRKWNDPTPALSLAWTSQGEPGLERADQHPCPRGSWPCRPVEYISRPDRESIADPAAAALARHEHAVVVSIYVQYYENEDARTGPARLRKRWLPVMW